ncbi:MAG: T9SS type A sorting domain-containing protein [Bacteroidia bacterium]|nr:T9SS type A sorting domain-containing protein [Bacteroidia bacterium]
MKTFLPALIVLILTVNKSFAQSSNGNIYPCEVLPPILSYACYQNCWLDTLHLGGDTNLIKLSSSCDLWQIGNNQKPEFGNPGADFGIETDLDSSYSTGNSCSFWITPPSNPFQWASTVLMFEHRYSTDSLKDGGVIEYSCNGTDWSNVVNDNFISPTFKSYINFPLVDDYGNYNPASIPTLDDLNYSFTGTSDTWIWSGFEFIWAFPVKSIQNNQNGCEFSNMDSLLFRFTFHSDTTFDNKPGWMIRNIVVGSIDLGSGINEFTQNSPIVYPNPTNDLVFLSESYLGANFEILNSMGQQVSSGYYTSSGISTSELSEGNYWIRGYLGQIPWKTTFVKY